MISSKPQEQPAFLAGGPLPHHIAIIMDGNRRWAADRRLPAAEGYRRGMIALREITIACSRLGIPFLTVYGFSEENWKRSWSEISILFELCCVFARAELQALCRENVRVKMLGRYEALPQAPREALQSLVENTAGNTGTILTLAVNYSARGEMRDAVRTLAEDVRGGRVAPETITDATLSAYLYTADMPDPDLLIRPGGELRLSNFLLYQVAYTELWMTETQWPDFTREHLKVALAEYQRRQRRYGS